MKTTRTSIFSAPIAAVGLAALLAVVPGSAQSTDASSGAAAPAQTTSTATPDSTQSATGKPLSTKSNEGFWGHLNPLARKKWVNRQVNPVKDRVNELDGLTAKNASDIKDYDARAQAGISKAQSTADQANTQAQGASTQANQAQMLAAKANTQTGQINTTVSNLDQYQPITDTEIHFQPGQIQLNAKAKDALDQIASQLQGQKGYIVEVQGYSHARGQAGIATSQKISDAVVRYLVVDHQIPVYRIHLIALGNAPIDSNATDTKQLRGSLVHVTLMHNSLAGMGSADSSANSPIGATQNK